MMTRTCSIKASRVLNDVAIAFSCSTVISGVFENKKIELFQEIEKITCNICSNQIKNQYTNRIDI